MNERAQTLVRSAGLNEMPTTALERGDSIFVLTPQTLLYQDAAGTRRVTLRDLTRIHSDQDGQLRVETPAGTALTASLLGYDPVAVQTFFAQVRDATAAVKQAQVAPTLPASAPAQPAQPVRPAPQPSAAPVAPMTTPTGPAHTEPTSTVPTAAPTPGHDSVTVARTAPQGNPVPQPGTPQRPDMQPGIQQPVTQQPGTQSGAQPMPGVPLKPVQVPVPGVREVREQPARESAPVAAPPRPMPVFQPAPATPASKPETPRPAQQPAPVTEPLPSLVTPVPIPAESAQPVSDLATSSNSSLSTAAPLDDLAGRASQVGAWVGRLRFLSVVMLLAAFALAYLQFRSGLGLSAVWVLIAGGMAAVALYALADLTKLLVGIAQNLSRGTDVD